MLIRRSVRILGALSPLVSFNCLDSLLTVIKTLVAENTSLTSVFGSLDISCIESRIKSLFHIEFYFGVKWVYLLSIGGVTIF